MEQTTTAGRAGEQWDPHVDGSGGLGGRPAPALLPERPHRGLRRLSPRLLPRLVHVRAHPETAPLRDPGLPQDGSAEGAAPSGGRQWAQRRHLV